MLRLRLFCGLGAIVLLLWIIGISALLLMKSSVTKYETQFQKNWRAIEATAAIRSLITSLNTSVTLDPAELPADRPIERMLSDNAQGEIKRQLAIIKQAPSPDARWNDELRRLDDALSSFITSYDRFLSLPSGSRQDQSTLVTLINTQSDHAGIQTDSLSTILEGDLFTGADRLTEQSGRNMLFVSAIVLLGTITAIMVYFQLSAHLVGPVSALHQSIEGIRKGNFEQSLPVPAQKNEFASVVSSFNEMAAELNAWRSQNNEEFKRSDILNRAILLAIPSPVYVLGDDCRFIEVNPAAEELSENLGIAGRLPSKIQSIVDECGKNRNHYLPQDPHDALVFRINDQEVYYLPRIFRIDAENESLSGWAVLLHNVSRIRWLDDMKTNLIATVSHEIKTPLTGIRMVLLLLLEEKSGRLDKIQRTLINSASGDCERLLSTVNSLLALSHAESGATHLNRIPLCLHAYVEAMKDQFVSAAGNKGIELDVEGGEEKFPKVLADPIRLAEVIDNLVSNAINHSPTGGRVVLKLSKPDAEHIRLSVMDEGAGVPESSQSRIFERFYRAPDQPSQGLGLGLFISRDIMTAHEGRIGLLERSDHLTEFFIDVPIA